MKFNGIQRSFACTQINHGAVEDVFPLLCPVREKDWIDGWDYQMIHSQSGLAEMNCVFITPHHGELATIWQITQYDPVQYLIEFVRVTPNENMVRINIRLEPLSSNQTKAFISYLYTALSEEHNTILREQMESSFMHSMDVWESSINHYLEHGTKLISKH